MEAEKSVRIVGVGEAGMAVHRQDTHLLTGSAVLLMGALSVFSGKGSVLKIRFSYRLLIDNPMMRIGFCSVCNFLTEALFSQHINFIVI